MKRPALLTWLRAHPAWVAALAALVLTLVWCRALLAHLGEHGQNNDWDQHLAWYWAARKTVIDFHQMPLWNPYLCGGTPMLGNSQSHILTPMFLLQLAFGESWGLHLEILLHFLIGALGGYALGRALQLRPLAAFAIGAIFMGSSWAFLHLGEGHGWSMAYAYSPAVLACAVLACRDRKLLWAAGSGALLALMANEGGIYPTPHAAMLLAVLCIAFAAQQRSLFPFAVLALAGALAFLFAAPKLLPVLELMRRDPRLWADPESAGWRVIAEALFSHDQDRYRALPTDRWYWQWHEYGSYIGLFSAVLALLGLVLAFKKCWPFAIAALVFFILALGDYTQQWKPRPEQPISPWGMLHLLPFFSSQHVPSRFLITLVLVLAVTAAFGADALQTRFPGWGFALAGALLLLAVVDMARVGPPNLGYMFQKPQPDRAPSETFRQLWDPSDRTMFVIARSNQGALNCYDWGHLKSAAHAANRTGYRGEVYLLGAGEVTTRSWSPNRLVFEVQSPAETTLVVNQNYDFPWRAVGGGAQAFSFGGLLAVHVPAGAQEVVLEYRSRPFVVGLLLFLLGLVAAAALAAISAQRIGGFPPSDAGSGP